MQILHSMFEQIIECHHKISTVF